MKSHQSTAKSSDIDKWSDYLYTVLAVLRTSQHKMSGSLSVSPHCSENSHQLNPPIGKCQLHILDYRSWLIITTCPTLKNDIDDSDGPPQRNNNVLYLSSASVEKVAIFWKHYLRTIMKKVSKFADGNFSSTTSAIHLGTETYPNCNTKFPSGSPKPNFVCLSVCLSAGQNKGWQGEAEGFGEDWRVRKSCARRQTKEQTGGPLRRPCPS